MRPLLESTQRDNDQRVAFALYDENFLIRCDGGFSIITARLPGVPFIHDSAHFPRRNGGSGSSFCRLSERVGRAVGNKSLQAPKRQHGQNHPQHDLIVDAGHENCQKGND